MNNETQILLDTIESAKLSRQHTLSFNGKTYYVFAITYITFDTLMILRDKYYLVRGWILDGRGWGYTIVFNTHLKGIYNHYPND